jgi:predicted DNA-binding transcriptional regulator YafY
MSITSLTLRQSFSDSASLRTIVSLYEVVQFISVSNQSLSVQEIASCVGLSTNTVYLYISYLLDMGIPVRRFSDGTYTLCSTHQFFQCLEHYIRQTSLG